MTKMGDEYYVSAEQGQMLKELDFDWPCDHVWHKEFTDSDQMVLRQCSADDYNHDDWDLPHCSAPALHRAQRWLREKHNIEVYPLPRYQQAYESVARLLGSNAIMTTYLFDMWDYQEPFRTYEESLSAGLTKALRLLIDGGVS